MRPLPLAGFDLPNQDDLFVFGIPSAPAPRGPAQRPIAPPPFFDAVARGAADGFAHGAASAATPPSVAAPAPSIAASPAAPVAAPTVAAAPDASAHEAEEDTPAPGSTGRGRALAIVGVVMIAVSVTGLAAYALRGRAS